MKMNRMRHLALLVHAAALVAHRKPSTRCLRRVIARTATEPSPPAAGAAPAKRPSRDRRLALAVEALETGARDDRDAVSAKVETLRLKVKGQMRAKLDGLRETLHGKQCHFFTYLMSLSRDQGSDKQEL